MKARAIKISALATALFTLLVLSIACAPGSDSSVPQPAEKTVGTEVGPPSASKADTATPTPVQYPAKSDPELAALYTVEVEYWTEGNSVTLNVTIIGGPSSNEKMHCQSQQSQWGDGINQAMKPDCPPYNEGDRFQRTWLIVHKYAEPGPYEVRFNYGKLYSDTISIRIEEPETPPASRPFTPQDAAEQPDGSHISVEGMLYIGKDGVLGLCGFVFSSLPPLCYPPLNVENLKFTVYESLEYKNGIGWSPETVTITGTMLNGVLVADD